MPDMLVHLLKVKEPHQLWESLKDQNIQIRRALAPDKFKIIDWVKEHSSVYAAGEADVCFSHHPISLFVATRGKEILGYACYNATALNFFGPTKVLESEQGKSLGKALLIRSLLALRHEGYVYAIIGGVGPAEFYTKTVGATLIPDSVPGIYEDFLSKKD